MFYIALVLFILLGLLALAILGLNLGSLLGGVRINLLIWHPTVPVLLLCVLAAFLGGLLLFVVSSLSARRDEQVIKKLRTRLQETRARVEELEQLQAKTNSGGLLSGNFAQPLVPLPGLPPSPPGPGPQGGLLTSASLPQRPPTGPLSQRPPTGSFANPAPSPAAANQANVPPPLRTGPPPPLPQNGSSSARPPFFQQ